jgi:MSHA biogenesis protein MshL
MSSLTGAWRLIVVVALGLCPVSCATLRPPETGQETLAAGSEAAPETIPAEASEAPAQPPSHVSEALLPPMRFPQPEEAASEESRFDVAVSGVSARQFFMDLVGDTEYDIVVHPDVEGTLSLTLKDATIPEILSAVREVYGYEFQRTTTGFYVLPPRLQTRIFHIDYLHMQRSGSSETRISSGQLSDAVAGAGGLGSVGLGPTTTGSTRRGVIESSEVRTESATDLWEEFAAAVHSILGSEEGRSVVVSPQAGIVVVRAMPAELRQVEEFLSRAEISLQRQVILEAKILEVQLDDRFRAGINWAALVDWANKSILAAQTGGGTLLEDGGVSEIAGNTGTLDPNALSPVSNTDTSAFGGVFSVALDLHDFTGFIELLETQGTVRVLSSPRVSTINNQKALIKVGQDEFFVTDVSTTTVTGTATTTTPQVELTPFFSGIALDVMPQISEDGAVILHVHPSVSRVVDQIKEISVGDDLLTLPLALSTIRESDSIVRARSGQVVIIGGLMQERGSDDQARIPWVGRIPYLGNLFGQTEMISFKSELVILLRPTVVGEKTWQEEVTHVEERLGWALYGVERGRLSSQAPRDSAP